MGSWKCKCQMLIMAVWHFRRLLYDSIRAVYPVMSLESHNYSLFTRQSRADTKVAVSACTTFSDSTMISWWPAEQPSCRVCRLAGAERAAITHASPVDLTIQFASCHLLGVCVAASSHTRWKTVLPVWEVLAGVDSENNTLPLPEMPGKLSSRLSVCINLLKPNGHVMH